MREFRTYGSVRGALSNERLYRDPPRREERRGCRLDRSLGQGGDDDVERISAAEPRGVDGGAHIRFGTGGPHGAIAVGHLSLDHGRSKFSFGGVVGNVHLAGKIAEREQLISGASNLGL